MGEPAKREPMRLPLVFLFGFLASFAVIGGLIWLFAAYETRSLLPMFHRPLLSQETWFEIIRNAVTTAAALGVGITLFFSYRRQQTAEKTQLIALEAQLTSAKAQETAAKALELSNKQHALDMSRRQDAVIAELRTRYAKTAEQLGSDHLAVRMAGIYSLGALADDWAEKGNQDERQVCIDLLCGYLRAATPDENQQQTEEMARAIYDIVTLRLRRGTGETKHWGRATIALRDPGVLHKLQDLVIEDNGSLTVTGVSLDKFYHLGDVELRRGKLTVEGLSPEGGPLHGSDIKVLGGELSIVRIEQPNQAKQWMNAHLHDVVVEGGTFSINLIDSELVLEDCVFNNAILVLCSDHVLLHRCRFIGRGNHDLEMNYMRIDALSLRVSECMFLEGAAVLEDYGDDRDWEAALSD